MRKARFIRRSIAALATALLVAWLINNHFVEADLTSSRGLQKSEVTTEFGPSNARTQDGRLIPAEHFISANRCQACHQDTHQGWSQSLHRNAAREPFYRESADILLKTRGIELTRHCESCHTPVALFSGALSKTSVNQTAPFTKFDDEGITCSICHSITDARLDGTGSYTIRRPALLAKEDGAPLYALEGREISNDDILADIPAHKRAVMRPLLKSPEFCSTCHKVDAPPSLNGYKHIKGFTAYDEWQQSGASHESVLPFYRREQRTDCRACHMPKVESRNDRAAKQGKIASHRWLGANTVAPLFYGQHEQVQQTTAFLKADVLNVDIFAIRKEITGELLAPLSAKSENQYSLHPGEALTAEVVIANRNAAHSFPPEVRDLYEAWVEFEALDAKGKTIFHSGFLKPDGMLDEGAHVYKLIILDDQGRQITRHQIWTTNIKAYDNAIPPGRSDVVRYRFTVPECPPQKAECGNKKSNAPVAITLRARVNYRRLNQEYTNYILKQQKKMLTVPIVQMAEATTVISSELKSANSQPSPGEARRWNDYGIALLEQAQYGPAAEAFCRAAALDPNDPNLLTNAAIAEMRTDRLAHHEREQLRKAENLLEQAIQLAGAAPDRKVALLRARYFRALVWRANEKYRAAANELQEIAHEFPRDREVQRQLGQTLYTLGEYGVARTAFEVILGIDPTDAAAWQFLTPLYLQAGIATQASLAREKYLLWRDDPNADGIAARFYIQHPQWADERVGAHVHGAGSAQRPVLIGKEAVPDR